MGVGTGPWSAAGQSYLITSVHTRRLGLGGAIYFLSNTAGSSLGSLATGLIKDQWTFPQIGSVMTAALGGVFLLAEQTDLEGAAKALGGARDAPGVAIYQDRLRRLSAGVQGMSAAEAFAKALVVAEEKLKGGDYESAKQALAQAAKLTPGDPRPRQVLDGKRVERGGVAQEVGVRLPVPRRHRAARVGRT